MPERFAELHRLKGIEANQTDIRLFAIDQALTLLMKAGVVDSETPADPSILEENSTVKGFLKRTRRSIKPKVSQEDVARKAGISLAWYQAIEQGKKISSGFGVDSLVRSAVAVGLDDETAVWFVKANNPRDVSPTLLEPTVEILLGDYRSQITQKGQITRTRDNKIH